MLRNLMLVLAYDGTDFHGWQFQPEMRTVQECLEQALRRTLRHRVNVLGCSRTDSGVHAAGYVANVFTPSEMRDVAVMRSAGSRLPKDITLLHVREVPLTFHATRSSVTKLYRYRIHNAVARPCEAMNQSKVYHVWNPLDVDRMRAGAAAWVGTHDFSSFASAGNDRQHNVRTIHRIEIYRDGEEVRIDIEGDGFLYKQVRNMVGTLCEFGRGHWTPEFAVDILEARNREKAGPTAPARGLCLQWVKYDLVNLPEPTPEMLEKARAVEAPAGERKSTVDQQPMSTAPGIDVADINACEPPA
ncbi:MAG: tRNA pseudouridine(38-40) synthase TruA [Phycisphaerales bacterium]|nr:tRNA pseudouridine(38-40) synthase TruA [Phycisphaerales bacterium]MCB9863883.1 tRNA pseudouridine(38-40) synthase TruA [Phycisphaerales bacterium]